MLIVAVLVFLMLRLTPGDPAAIMPATTPIPSRCAIRNRLGLDQPLFSSSSSGADIFTATSANLLLQKTVAE